MDLKTAGVVALALMLTRTANPPRAAGPSHVDITWLSITNIYYEIGPLRILTDAYITRLPRSLFSGGGGGLAKARPSVPDVAAVTRVLTALGGPASVTLLLNGHAHFDHSFDTATWSKLSGARIIGSKTTCLQAQAQHVPADRCTAVEGGERIALGDGVTMRVVRWNHSGDPSTNPEQHNPVELDAVPHVDPETGGLDPGVAADFPIAERVLPVIKPRAYLPVHWDSFWTPFAAGVDKPYADAPLKDLLAKSGVQLIVPVQYMDKWRLDRAGVRAIPNAAVKNALGFKED